MKNQIIEYSSPTKVRSVMCIGKYHSKAFENCLPMKVEKFLWTIWICLWSSCTQPGSYNAISRNYTGRFKFWDLTSKMLQILKSYLLNSELWSNLTLCCLSHESGMIVCNLEPKILQHQLSWQQLIKYQKFLHNAILVFLLVLYMSYSNCELRDFHLCDPWRMDPVSWIIILQLNWLSTMQRRKRQALDKSRGQRFAQKTWQLYFGQQLTFSLGPIGQKQRQKTFPQSLAWMAGFLPSYFRYLHTFFTSLLSLLSLGICIFWLVGNS